MPGSNEQNQRKKPYKSLDSRPFILVPIESNRTHNTNKMRTSAHVRTNSADYIIILSKSWWALFANAQARTIYQYILLFGRPADVNTCAVQSFGGAMSHRATMELEKMFSSSTAIFCVRQLIIYVWRMKKFDKNFSHSMRNMSASRSGNRRAEKVRSFLLQMKLLGWWMIFCAGYLVSLFGAVVFHVSFQCMCECAVCARNTANNYLKFISRLYT